MPNSYRLEARLSNAITKLSGVDWCIPHHVKRCDYDLIEHMVDIVIRDSVDGAVTRFFSAFYRDDTPSQFMLATVGPEGLITATRVFENCVVLKHKVASEDETALLSHNLALRYENLIVS